MKTEIINVQRKKDAIQPTIGFSLALALLIICGIFDVREFGVEIKEGPETIIYWIFKMICIILIPVFVFLLINFIKRLFKDELIFRESQKQEIQSPKLEIFAFPLV